MVALAVAAATFASVSALALSIRPLRYVPARLASGDISAVHKGPLLCLEVVPSQQTAAQRYAGQQKANRKGGFYLFLASNLLCFEPFLCSFHSSASFTHDAVSSLRTKPHIDHQLDLLFSLFGQLSVDHVLGDRV